MSARATTPRGFLVASCLLLFTLAPGEGLAARRYAVLIGNNLGHPDEPALRFAERDATELGLVLRRLGGVPPQNAVVVLGEGVEQVRQTLLEVNARIRAEEVVEDEPSTLLVYYSGHADALGLHPRGGTLSYAELRALVAGSSARARVLLIDGCRSGGLTEVKGGRPAPNFGVPEGGSTEAEGLVLISSSAASEDSHESERLGGSFFTHHFINALLGMGDQNEDARVTVSEAYAYAYEQTLRSSGRTESLQHPTYAYALKGRGDLVLTWLKEDTGRLARLTLGEPGTYLIFRGRETGPVLAELFAEAPGAHVTLDPGTYYVERRGADHYREYRVTLRPGQDLALDAVPYRAVRYARLVRKGVEERGLNQGLHVSGTARGKLLDGEAPLLGVLLGYELELPWASFSIRGRYGATQSQGPAPRLGAEHRELALGLGAQRFVDLPWFSVGIGLLVEGILHRQSFATAARAPRRDATALAFGGVVTLERELTGPLVLRLEGGPISQVFRVARIRAGAESGSEMVTPLTGWASVGLGWKL